MMATLMVGAAGMGAPGSVFNYVPATDQFAITTFLSSTTVEHCLRSTTVDRYFQSDREAREMLEREHRAARRFVQRQKAAIDACTDALYLAGTLNDDVIYEILGRLAVPEPTFEEEVGAWSTPESRDRLVPWAEPMPANSVPETTQWIET